MITQRWLHCTPSQWETKGGQMVINSTLRSTVKTEGWNVFSLWRIKYSRLSHNISPVLYIGQVLTNWLASILKKRMNVHMVSHSALHSIIIKNYPDIVQIFQPLSVNTLIR